MVLNKILGKYHIQFRDRIAVANILGDLLKDYFRKKEKKNLLVLAIPRAGVLTANVVSTKLPDHDFDLIIPRKLRDPLNEEHSIGAILEDGFRMIDPNVLERSYVSESYLNNEINYQLNEIMRRKRLYFKDGEHHDIKNAIASHATIVIIDDGSATGYTSLAAAKWINSLTKFRDSKKNLIIALPVVPRNIVCRLQRQCDATVLVAYSPLEHNFKSLEQYHRDFRQVNDNYVIQVVKKRKLL